MVYPKGSLVKFTYRKGMFPNGWAALYLDNIYEIDSLINGADLYELKVSTTHPNSPNPSGLVFKGSWLDLYETKSSRGNKLDLDSL